MNDQYLHEKREDFGTNFSWISPFDKMNTTQFKSERSASDQSRLRFDEYDAWITVINVEVENRRQLNCEIKLKGQGGQAGQASWPGGLFLRNKELAWRSVGTVCGRLTTSRLTLVHARVWRVLGRFFAI